MKKKILIISIITLIFDFLIKRVVLHYINYQQVNTIIPHFFYLTYVKNTGGAFSILSNNVFLLLIIGIIAVILLSYYLIKKAKYTNLEIISYGLIFGGLLGNLIDRIFYHSVVDYLGFIFGSYYFPVFNLADMCIVISVFLLIYIEVKGD